MISCCKQWGLPKPMVNGLLSMASIWKWHVERYLDFLAPMAQAKLPLFVCCSTSSNPLLARSSYLVNASIRIQRSLLPRVGALIEQPAFQSYLSGRDNLIVVGGYTGGVDPNVSRKCLRLWVCANAALIATPPIRWA